MANFCLLCGKKLGFFTPSVDNFLTDDTREKVCENCFNLVDAISQKVEMKIPVTEADFEAFHEEGKKTVEKYIGEMSEILIMPQENAQADIMDLEIGEAIINQTFEVDDNEADAVFQQLKAMREEEIEEFLNPLVSIDETADSFMREIKSLTDDELKSVLADQREYYNNAEWGYILYVNDFREYLKSALDEKVESKNESDFSAEPVPENLDMLEVERMKEIYAEFTREELKEIVNDASYTYEARMAAKSLL